MVPARDPEDRGRRTRDPQLRSFSPAPRGRRWPKAGEGAPSPGASRHPLRKRRGPSLAIDLRRWKREGFSDRQHREARRSHRKPGRSIARDRRPPLYKRVDTCAAEFEASTPYLYSTYEQEDESQPTRRRKVMILGSGPNRSDGHRVRHLLRARVLRAARNRLRDDHGQTAIRRRFRPTTTHRIGSTSSR